MSFQSFRRTLTENILVREGTIHLVAQLLQCRNASVVDHRWGTAHQHQGIIGRLKQVLLDHVGADEALALGPLGLRPVQGVPQFELVRIASGQVVQFRFQQDVVFGLKYGIRS